MGRRRITLTEAQKVEVETLAAVLSAEQVADYFGIGRTTFFAMIARDPEIAERYKRGKARAIGAIAQRLIQKARNGDTTSMIFYLKTQANWRERTEVEHIPALEPRHDPEADARKLVARINAMAERLRSEGTDRAGLETSADREPQVLPKPTREAG
jgi:hypothetical protein